METRCLLIDDASIEAVRGVGYRLPGDA